MLETDIVLNGGGIAPSSILLEGPTNTKKFPKLWVIDTAQDAIANQLDTEKTRK